VRCRHSGSLERDSYFSLLSSSFLGFNVGDDPKETKGMNGTGLQTLDSTRTCTLSNKVSLANPANSVSLADSFEQSQPPPQSRLLDTLSLHYTAYILIFYFFIAGLVDAITLSGFRLVFCSNQTGNLLFLGIAAIGYVANVPEQLESAVPHLVSVAGFCAGALVTGQTLFRLQIGAIPGPASSRIRIVYLASDTPQALLLGAGALMALLNVDGLAVLAVLSFAEGIQGSHARLSGVVELSATTVITSVLIDLVSDPKILAWPPKANLQRNRGAAAVLSMFAGSVVGAVFVFKVSVAAGLAVAFGLKVGCAGAWLLVPGEKGA
jgi:uncharacterized membrane protein YoaK (UPF0700 family)